MENSENNSDQKNTEKYNEGISYGGVNSNESTDDKQVSGDDDGSAERLSDYPAGNETEDEDSDIAASEDSDDENFEEDPEHPQTDPAKLDKL